MNRSAPRALRLAFTSILTLATAASASAQEAREEAELSHPTPGELDGAGYADSFGYDVDISADGTRVVVGSPNDDTSLGANVGTAYVFSRVGTTWSLDATLAPEGPGPAANQQFGVAVAMSSDGSRVVIGRPGADAVTGSNPEGGVDVFVRDGSGWAHEAFLAGIEEQERFGISLDLSDDGATLVVGAPGTSHQGDARVFVRSGTTWALALDVVPPELGFFGAQVAISGDASRIAISIPTSGSGPGGVSSGGARIYRRMGATWIEEQAIYPSFAAVGRNCFDSLGFDRTGTRLFGGCVFDGPGAMPNRGAVAAFVRTGTSWSEEAVLRAIDGGRDDYFGVSVSLSPDGSRALVGAYGDTTFPVRGAHGSVRVFDRVGATWTEIATATTRMLEGGPGLGVSVAIVDDGARFVAGAPGDGEPGDAFFTSARVFTFGEPMGDDAGVVMADAAVAEDAGTASTLDAATLSPDAASIGADAGAMTTSDAAGARDAGAPAPSSSGCGCRAPISRGPSTPGWIALLAIAGIALARVRRARSRARAASLAVVVVVSMIAGCGGGDPAIDAGPTATPDAHVDPSTDARDPSVDAPSTETTRTTIGAAGGTARSADGLFELVVTAGALTDDVEIAITPVPASDVPADVAATEPISTVYSVEPDGLTFGGDGAYARFHWDASPADLVDESGSAPTYAAAFGLARPASGGTIEPHEVPETVHAEDGSVELITRLVHLSLQWAVRRWDGGEYWLGTDFGASPHEVGLSWFQTSFVRAEFGASSAFVGLVARERRILPSGMGYSLQPLSPSDEARVALGLRPLGGLLIKNVTAIPRATDTLVTPPATWTCRSVGRDVLTAVADFTPLSRYAPRVYREAQSECVAPVEVDVSILDTIPGFREDAVILTDAAPLPEVRVETRGEGTRTVNLEETPYWVTLEPAGAAAPSGPATITATNGGATVTATRDPLTGEYAALVDDPSLWEADVLTRVLFGGTTPVDVMPVPPFSLAFGAVDGLDTNLTSEANTQLAIRFPGELRCGLEDVVDVVLFRSIVDELPIDGPLREGLALLATHCERTVAELTARPFTVELSRAERVLVDMMPGVSGAIRVGRAVSVSGADLLATCGGARPTFCRDRCVDTTADPMNCGGCGVVGVEVCDGLDSDCDGYVDNTCPTTITWPTDIAETSARFGDTMSTATGFGGSRGAFFNPYIGLCGTTNGDGTIRSMVAMLGNTTLRRTGPDAFAIDVTPNDNSTCADTTLRNPTGGEAFSAECPSGMIAEGVSGQAPMMGHIGQLTVLCARWGVSRDVTRRWVIRRTESGMSMSVGTGPGMPYSFSALDDPTTDNPPALRYLRSSYRSLAPGGMPGGTLWFEVGAISPVLR